MDLVHALSDSVAPDEAQANSKEPDPIHQLGKSSLDEKVSLEILERSE